jgi:hypothetical protein
MFMWQLRIATVLSEIHPNVGPGILVSRTKPVPEGLRRSAIEPPGKRLIGKKIAGTDWVQIGRNGCGRSAVSVRRHFSKRRQARIAVP